MSLSATNRLELPHSVPGKTAPADRVVWFDYAKGLCIILVVMMHSTLGVGEAFAERGLAAEGFMHWIVAYAKPFRMPDFFLLAGLFLAFAIDRKWMHYLDKKVVHFAYFYLVWMLIQLPLRAAATGDLSPGGLATAFVDGIVSPYPTLWFIYVLPIMFVVAKLLRPAPALALLAVAAVWQAAPALTGVKLMDEQLAPYFVFFLAGYILAPWVFRLADWTGENALLAMTVVAGWAILNGALVATPSPIEGYANAAAMPGVSLLLGAFGASAIVMVASLLAHFDLGRFIRFCGANSIVIYVSFTIPMAISRMVLMKLGVIEDVGVVSMLVWLTALITPLAAYLILKRTPLKFLYQRPSWIALPYDDRRRQATDTLVERRKRAVVAGRL